MNCSSTLFHCNIACYSFNEGKIPDESINGFFFAGFVYRSFEEYPAAGHLDDHISAIETFMIKQCPAKEIGKVARCF